MSYPAPPWTIQGYGFFNLHLLDVERVRSFIPSQFQIISTIPGKTIGGVYIASYQAGSSLLYNELIVVSGLVAYTNHIGAWISHIYVDNPDSVAGGREIWGLPKELAQFVWNRSEKPSVKVTQGAIALCEMSCQWQGLSLPLPPLTAPVLTTLETIPAQFQAKSQLQLQLIGVTLDVPSTSPFAALNLGQGWLSFYSDRLSVTVDPPTKIMK
jgi:hypothetical protein